MNNKMTTDQLNALRALPLDIKIRKTELRIREWYEHFNGEVIVSFSGGKDSTVLLDIARRLYPDIEAVFSDTGLEYPEIKEFVKTFPNVTIVRPKYSFKQILTKYGYPIISKEVANVIKGARRWIDLATSGGGYKHLDLNNLDKYTPPLTIRAAKMFGLLDKNNKVNYDIKNDNKSLFSTEKWAYLLESDFKISDQCCYHMKKSPLDRYVKKINKKPIVATMTEESRLRRTAWLRTGCNAYTGRQISKPMSFWTEQDVLEYIYTKGLKIAPVYGSILYNDNKCHLTGCKRTGCVFCGFGCHLERKPNRFQRLKETHPKLYDYCMNGGEHNDEGWWQPSNEGLGMKKVMDFIGVET